MLPPENILRRPPLYPYLLYTRSIKKSIRIFYRKYKKDVKKSGRKAAQKIHKTKLKKRRKRA